MQKEIGYFLKKDDLVAVRAIRASFREEQLHAGPCAGPGFEDCWPSVPAVVPTPLLAGRWRGAPVPASLHPPCGSVLPRGRRPVTSWHLEGRPVAPCPSRTLGDGPQEPLRFSVPNPKGTWPPRPRCLALQQPWGDYLERKEAGREAQAGGCRGLGREGRAWGGRPGLRVSFAAKDKAASKGAESLGRGQKVDRLGPSLCPRSSAPPCPLALSASGVAPDTTRAGHPVAHQARRRQQDCRLSFLLFETSGRKPHGASRE